MNKANSLKPLNNIPDSSYFMSGFAAAVNDDIQSMNKLINQYNNMAESDQVGRLKLLQTIYQHRHAMENKYSAEDIAKSHEYRTQIENNLFVQLQEQFQNHGIQSMRNILNMDVTQTATLPPPQPGALADLIANMHPTKVVQLRKALENRADISSIYAINEPGFSEFQTFLNNNKVTFLGGGNSLNYKVTPNDGSPPLVLKVENRMGGPKGVEAHLRNIDSLKDTFLTVFEERQSCSIDARNMEKTHGLVVTEFCTGGDILSHGQGITDVTARTTAAFGIYSQMGTILEEMQKSGCAFPDMKNTNWLVDSTGTLRVADTKSFLFTDKDGNVNMGECVKQFYPGCTSSDHIEPPEIHGEAFSTPFRADKMHAFMLGKNLYQYLTNSFDTSLNNLYDASNLNFDHDVFKTTEGKKFKGLICQLVQPNAEDRPSLHTALQQLDEIRLTKLVQDNPIIAKIQKLEMPEAVEFLKQDKRIKACLSDTDFKAIEDNLALSYECLNEIKKIKSLGFGKTDEFMNRYAQEQLDKLLKNSGDVTSLKNFKKELEDKYIELNNPTTQEMKKIVNTYRNDNHFYTVGKEAKAIRIEQQMAKLSFEERRTFSSESQGEKQKDVMTAVASHRHIGRSGPLKEINGKIDEEKCAKHFKDFKAKIADVTAQKPADQTEMVKTQNGVSDVKDNRFSL